MSEVEQELPEFQAPPVIEVVCGVAFPPVPGFTVAHIGRWWNELGADYVEVTEVPPLAVVIEGHEPQAPDILAEPMPTPRVWFERTGGDHLVQLQRDRLLSNWRKITADHVYPRYATLSEDFFNLLARFEAFCGAQTEHRPELKQYELTYINHIPQDDGWSSVGDLGKVLPDLAWRQTDRFLPAAEGLEAQLSFALPEDAGRLHVRAQTARRRLDNEPVLVLELTARGFLEDRRKWFATAHEWIVRGFADITEPAIQQGAWRRR